MKSLIIYKDGALKWVNAPWHYSYEEVIFLGHPQNYLSIEGGPPVQTSIKTRYFTNISKERDLPIYLEKE